MRKPKVDLDNKYVKMLPASLKKQLRNDTIFIRACEMQLIVCENGKWTNYFPNTSVFSLFCACCFCEDRVVGKKIAKGGYNIPVRQLERLFGVKWLKSGLKYYRKKKISWRCENIDFLFYM